ncbi:MAG: hypothetical protein Q9166_000014 [cf. Caloplaca sp. 2 TL-2023]
MTSPIPVILCGRMHQIAEAVIAGLRPEYEAIHLILSPAAGKTQIPVLLQGKVPPSDDADNLGTKNYSKTPAAVLLGGGYEDADVAEMREACKNDSRVPWLRADVSKPAPPVGPEPLLRQRAIVPTAITACAVTTLLWPTTTVHAEGPPEYSLARKPIYDDLPPLRSKPQSESPEPTSSPTPTDRLANQIQRARLTIHGYSTSTESRVNNFMSAVLTQERSFTSTIASLAPPIESHERIMPGALYVLVAAMSGSILTRNRNILLRATVPFAVGIGVAWVVLPITTRNVADLVWTYEEKAPLIAENHLRVRGVAVEGWKQIKQRGEKVKGWSDERVRESREAVEGWVRKGR